MSIHRSHEDNPLEEPLSTSSTLPLSLDLTVEPDGSLRTIPLLSVVLSSTDALHNDLYQMVHGEIKIIAPGTLVSSSNTNTSSEDELDVGANYSGKHNNKTFAAVSKLERMSNLSFSQRRHELQWRLHQHTQCLQHVAALTAAHASTNLSQLVDTSSRALQVARTAGIEADEAQDALYFFHAQLFPSRASPHDVYGSLDVLLERTWWDIPSDVRLVTDPYNVSIESSWSKKEVDALWKLSVRKKLITGEVGWMKRQNYLQQRLLWNMSLSGGILKLTYGDPANDGTYPITALLTVLSSPHASSSTKHSVSSGNWTLLSIQVQVQPKTGEFHHQLETSQRQQYDLHRLCALAMFQAEVRTKETNKSDITPYSSSSSSSSCASLIENSTHNNFSSLPLQSSSSSLPPARPLHALFQVAHTFLLSWELELLSSQAQALRKGLWALMGGGVESVRSKLSSNNGGNSVPKINTNSVFPIHVTPVQFFDSAPRSGTNSNPIKLVDDQILGVVSISFWAIDDSYGPPSMRDILFDTHENGSESASTFLVAKSPNYTSQSNQLTFSIRANVNVGMIVSLSGFCPSLLDDARGLSPDQLASDRAAINEIRLATCNPLALSVSDALLGATRWCANQKCRAVSIALQPTLPSWIVLFQERGCISVSILVKYHTTQETSNTRNTAALRKGMPILFRLICDSRTGSFVVSYPRQCHLLRELSCNSLEASESVALRIASLPESRRKAARAANSGRSVRDAFEGLVRSMNVLGERVGVGGSWDDIDDKSAFLRERSIKMACTDAKLSLIKTCGMAALYGFAAVALGSAFGVDALSDIAGDAVPSLNGTNFLPAPPVSVILDEEINEVASTSQDGTNTKSCYAMQTLFSIVCSVSDESLSLYPIIIQMKYTSPSSSRQRTNCVLTTFQHGCDEINDHCEQKDNTGFEHQLLLSSPPPPPPLKKHKLNDANENCSSFNVTVDAEDLMHEVGRFASALVSTFDHLPLLSPSIINTLTTIDLDNELSM